MLLAEHSVNSVWKYTTKKVYNVTIMPINNNNKEIPYQIRLYQYITKKVVSEKVFL